MGRTDAEAAGLGHFTQCRPCPRSQNLQLVLNVMLFIGWNQGVSALAIT